MVVVASAKFMFGTKMMGAINLPEKLNYHFIILGT